MGQEQCNAVAELVCDFQNFSLEKNNSHVTWQSLCCILLFGWKCDGFQYKSQTESPGGWVCSVDNPRLICQKKKKKYLNFSFHILLYTAGCLFVYSFDHSTLKPLFLLFLKAFSQPCSYVPLAQFTLTAGQWDVKTIRQTEYAGSSTG